MRGSALAACAVALVLAGCGPSDQEGEDQAAAPAAKAAAANDPCVLVTAEEVGAIIGGRIVAARAADDSCTYETEDAQASSVTIEIAGAEQMEIARAAAGALKDIGSEAAREGGAAGEDVKAMLSESSAAPKIGDEALFGANSQLSVRKGNSYIAVQPPIMRSRLGEGNPMLSSEERRQMALAIAEKAVARLP